MKLMTILSAMTLFVAINASADSQYLDSKALYTCGGSVELRKAANGDLAIKIENLRSSACSVLKFYDVTSGRTIKAYDLNGTSYTLSKAQEASLSSDCRLGFTIGNGFQAYENFNIIMSWWSCYAGGGSTGSGSSSRYSYQWSNNGNCKVLVNGVYANRNASDSFCSGIQGKQVASYEFSNKGNCKLMIDGQYSNQNVSDYFCSARP